MTYKIITLGCKVNTYESNYISEALNKAGYLEDGDPEWIIINTCSVTNTAEQKTRKLINRMMREHQASKLAIVGCYSQLFFSDLTDNNQIKILLGNVGKASLADYIIKYDRLQETTKYIEVMENACFEDMYIKYFKGRTRAFLKIQDGCDNFCSYCIIPYTRGGVRAKALETVISEINDLVANGYQEIVLTGIHTGKYYDGDNDLYTLLKAIINDTKLARCRISSIEINELTNEIIDLLKNPRFARHLHIPLQTGDDYLLKLMNRKYDTNYFTNRIDYIRNQIPGIAITTDLIVGLPHESELLFDNVYNYVTSLNFNAIHVFPYALKNNTKAALMDKQVTEPVKKARVRKILELNQTLILNHHMSFVNKTVNVLFENKVGDDYVGHSSEYLKVKVKSNQDLTNQFIDIKIIDANQDCLIGEDYV